MLVIVVLKSRSVNLSENNSTRSSQIPYLTQIQWIPAIKKLIFAILGYRFLNFQVIYLTSAPLSFIETGCIMLFFKLCEAENINFVEYFVIDKHFLKENF